MKCSIFFPKMLELSSHFDLCGAFPKLASLYAEEPRTSQLQKGTTMTMRKTRATVAEIRKAILDYVAEKGNLTPSEIFYPIGDAFPHNNHWEIRQLVKDLQKENALVPDIIYGGLRAN